MEQSVLLAEVPVARSVQIRRTLAAVFFSVPTVAGMLLVFGLIGNFLLVLEVGFVVRLLACFLLYGTASNRVTKTTMLAVGCWMGCWTLLSLLTNLQLFALPNAVALGSNALYSLIWVYCFAVIVRNNSLQSDTVSWIGILSMIFAMGLILCFQHRIRMQAGASIEEMDSRLFTFFTLVYHVLFVIGLFKFARSAAFAGNYDAAPSPKGAFNPLNKYIVGAIVVAGVVSAALWSLYRFAAPVLRDL